MSALSPTPPAVHRRTLAGEPSTDPIAIATDTDEALLVCANCGARLVGPYCHACGQSADAYQRSLGALLGESFEHILHADGRLFRTLPDLVFHPARLTRNYIAGHRVAQTPPLRLFLVVVLLIFLAGALREAVQPLGAWYRADSSAETVPTLSPGSSATSRAFAAWLNPHLRSAVTHQREFALAVDSWFHRVAILMLPISTLILGALFFVRRGIFLFDHAIFSMHSLSFMGLLFTLITLVGMIGLAPLAAALVLAAPIHLFVHLRGVYRVGVFGALARTVLLFALSAAAVALLLVGVVGLELNGMVAR